MFFKKDMSVPHRNFMDRVKKAFVVAFPRTSQQKDFCLEDYDFITKLDDLLYDFDFMLVNKERYNIDWAFDQATEILRTIFTDVNNGIINKELNILRKHLYAEHQEALHESDIQLNALFRDIQQWEKDIEKYLISRARIFKFVSGFLTWLDVVLFFVIIILVSQANGIGTYLFSSPILIQIFSGFIIFLKVVLDRFFIMPWVEDLGWKMFMRLVKKMTSRLTSLVMVFLFLDWANKHYDALETLKKLDYYWNTLKKK